LRLGPEPRRLAQVLEKQYCQTAHPVPRQRGQVFAGRTMQTWAARNGVELRFIQPGKPVQNAYIESFSSRFVSVSPPPLDEPRRTLSG
jgi:putative transposase